jgi:hypothetical protein
VLTELIEVWVQLYLPDDRGITNHDRYLQIEQQTGVYPGPEFEVPLEISYLWGYFMDLNSTRGGGWGAAPITYSELYAWMVLTGVEISPWEVGILKEMDNAFLTTVTKIDKSRTKGKT